MIKFMSFLLKQISALILPIAALIIVPLYIEKNLVLRFDVEFIIGTIFAVAGLALILITISMFIRIGKGTLAPWSPTKKIVVVGLYSYVRNPMITGVLTTLVGESLIFHSTNIIKWFIIFFIINNIYFVLYEEPGLEKRFGEEYLEYKRNVPRWLPRLKPWTTNKPDDYDKIEKL